MSCTITKDILFNCEKPPVAGQLNEVIIIPKRIIDSITYNGTNHLIIEDITISAGGNRAFLYKGDAKLLASDRGLIKDEFADGYRHRIPFKIMTNTPDIKLELESLLAERHVAILTQNYKGNSGNAKYEVFGTEIGLEVTLLEDTEGKNSLNIELSTPDGFKEPHLPRNFFDTSETVTDAKVAALLVATTP